MINANFEVVHPGIAIAQAACTELAGLVHDELKRATELPWEQIIDGRRMLSYYADTSMGERVAAAAPTLSELRNDPLFVNRTGQIALNHYPPETAQFFHDDTGWVPPVDVIQFSPNGFFDYLDGNTIKRLPVGTGDIVRLQDIWVSHRGRNPSSGDRYTSVIANDAPVFLGEEE